jgi:hypothetical protein
VLAGFGFRRIGLLVGDDLFLAGSADDTFHVVRVADGALIQAFRHLGVGKSARPLHFVLELGDGRDPVVDGARAHTEEFAQPCLGGAEQAVIVRKLAVFGAVAAGASGGAHTPLYNYNIQSVNDHTEVFSAPGNFFAPRQRVTGSPYLRRSIV